MLVELTGAPGLRLCYAQGPWRALPMKILLRLAAIVGVLAIAVSARGAEFGGVWKGAFDFQGNNVALTFYLSSEGGAVTGTVEGLPTTPAEIHDGKIDGDTVTFSVNTDYQGQSYKLVFKGTRSSTDGSIHFTLGTEDGSWSSELVAEKGAPSGDSASSSSSVPASASSSAPESASSSASASTVPVAASGADSASSSSAVPVAASSADSVSSSSAASSSSTAAGTADLTGTWKGSFDYQGTAVPVTFHFTTKDGALTGTVEGMMEGASDKSAEIQDGTINGDAISFTVNTQYQGETFRIVYKGKADGEKIEFTFGTEDGTWSSQLTATRQAEESTK
jgi:hypothetical protein